MRFSILLPAFLAATVYAVPNPDAVNALSERAAANCPGGGPGNACPFGQFLVRTCVEFRGLKVWQLV